MSETGEPARKRGRKETGARKCNPAKRWCGTHNNYTEAQLLAYIAIATRMHAYYIIGQEGATEGHTPHLQMYFEFPEKVRPMTVFRELPGAHWEVARGSREENIEYCSKEGNFDSNFPRMPELRVLKEDQLYPWQSDLEMMLASEPDDRSIIWIWDPKGCKGKTQFCKYLCVKHKAVLLGGSKGDLLYVSYKLAARIYAIDLTRSQRFDLDYTGIELIKNGCYVSIKYESDMVVRGSPHVVVFANYAPVWERLSLDRWRVFEINDDKTLNRTPVPGLDDPVLPIYVPGAPPGGGDGGADPVELQDSLEALFADETL